MDTRRCLPYRGYVSGNTIYIFDEDLREAKETLLHEIIDLFVTRLSFIIKEPKVARTKQYNLKEVVVETLRKKMKNFERPLLIDKNQIGQIIIGSEIIILPAKKATKVDVEKAKKKLERLRKPE